MEDFDEMPTILIVEDEVLIGMALADELAEQGFAIAGPYSTAKSASEALERDNADIAFLDVNLGKGRTSYDLAKELVNRGTPIIFLTGYSELYPDQRRFANAIVLAKPVAINDAIAAANEALRRKQFNCES